MTSVMRSNLSARKAKRTLFLAQAEDEVVSLSLEVQGDAPEAEQARKHVGEQLLRHPNMNDTGRLPSFAMFHIGMQVRLTQSVEPPEGVVDATGEIVGIDFHNLEPQSHRLSASGQGVASVRVLHRQPLCVYVKLDDCDTEFLPPKPCAEHAVIGIDRTCSACSFYPGVLAVKPYTNKSPWSIEVVIKDGIQNKVRVIRRNLPIVCVKASTLHVMQGTTADPGLIYHWVFPRRLAKAIRWLVVYVALSRVRRLKSLRSFGLNKDIRKIMEGGPPDSLPAQWKKLFSEKEAQTALDADAAMSALGWT